MIGRFVFMSGPPDGFICLQLRWNGDRPEARVRSPDHVVEMLAGHEAGVRKDDDFMSLPIALGYAVMVSGLSGAGLIITGDRSVWPGEWGDLLDMQPVSLSWARSH